MVHGNVAYIREGAKQARNTLTGIHFQRETSLHSKQPSPGAARIYLLT